MGLNFCTCSDSSASHAMMVIIGNGGAAIPG
jgi:hypothetical protein